MSTEPGKIRNVAVVGHRGTGKTSLVEAMLFQAGKTNRLGAIDGGSTVSDWEEDEQRRMLESELAKLDRIGGNAKGTKRTGASGLASTSRIPVPSGSWRLKLVARNTFLTRQAIHFRSPRARQF